MARGWEQRSQSPWPELVSLPPTELKTHALLIGSTGSGKTNLIHHMIAQEILLGNSFCVFDMRGDLVKGALDMMPGYTLPEKVKVIDLRNPTRSAGFNPLHGKGDPYFRALNMLTVIEALAASWGVQLGETLMNATLVLTEAGEPITRLESLFYDRAFRYACLAACTSESVLSFWQRFDEMSPDRQAAMATPVLNKVSLLTSPTASRHVLDHDNPVDLETHLNGRGNVLLVSLAVDQTHGAGRMLARLVLSSVCRELFARVSAAESERNPIRLYVDEFENFGTEEFETILAEGRRFGVSLVLAHQTLAQLSPRMRSMILNNVGTKIAFRCGREDSITLNRDFTGDPKAIDLTELPTGVAVLWRRGKGTLEVEVNEPIVSNVGSETAISRRYMNLVSENQAPKQPTKKLGLNLFRPQVPPEPKPSPSGEDSTGYFGAQEDWL